MLDEDARAVAALAGITLGARQQRLFRDAMARTAAGRWAQGTVRFSRSLDREVILARELAGLFLLGERILHAAGSPQAAAGAFQRADEAAAGSILLSRRVRRVTRARGLERIRTDNGGEALFAVTGAGRGCRSRVRLRLPHHGGSGGGARGHAAAVPGRAA